MRWENRITRIASAQRCYNAFYACKQVEAGLTEAGAKVNKGAQRAVTGITRAPIKTAATRFGAAQELTPLMGAVN